MGSGKSSTGKALARLLHNTFIDVDDLILEYSDKKSINEIFEIEGEDTFREIERIALITALQKTNQIIATGGGTLIFNNPEKLRAQAQMNLKDIVILLDAQFTTCVDRCKHSDRRPLFRDLAKAKKLYDERLPLYHAIANIRVCIDKKNSHEVAKEIAQILNTI